MIRGRKRSSSVSPAGRPRGTTAPVVPPIAPSRRHLQVRGAPGSHRACLAPSGLTGRTSRCFSWQGLEKIGADLTEFQGLGQNLSSSDRSAHDDFELHTDVRNSPVTLSAGHQAKASVLLALRQRPCARNVPFAPPSFSASRTAEVSMRGARLVDASGIPPSR